MRATIAWTAEAPVPAVLLVQAATVGGQGIVDEHLEVTGAEVEHGAPRADGARPLRLHARGGPVRLRYTARIDLDPVPTGRAARAARSRRG